ncbi:DUF4962 domain-containing protein [Reichenbachiella sp. MALMAid0571]|uniref:DUF4962 domain-containing protein n=1 Tax=Reichenbachiella sp. MALMAid0571 TaxID=3143939 RepID=UPI0032DF26D4
MKTSLSILSTCLVFTILCSCSEDQSLTYLSLEVTETEPEGQFLWYYPEDEMQLQVNPPGFTWTKHQKATSYDFVLFEGKGNKTIQTKYEGLTNTVTALPDVLNSGLYSWLVVYKDSIGNAVGRSKLRTFNLKKGLPTLPMPDMADLSKQVEGIHPRLFLTPQVLTDLKETVMNDKAPLWELCRSLADSSMSLSLPPEPAPYKDSVFEVSEWRRIYRPAKIGTANMVRMGLIWSITKEQKYLEGAKQWLMHFASWNPDGITSFRVPQASGFVGNTEASMPMLERMAMVYDWIGEELSKDEKEVVLSSIRARGNQMLKRYEEHNFLSEPWDNHTVRSLAFTGLAGLATLGDLPDAEKWLEYVIKCYITSFPTWGGDDGGWSQGLAYSSTYNLYQTNFVEALSLCTNVNLYNKPFFRNNGYFGVYCHPPYAKRGGFGDGGEDSHSPKDILLTRRYAEAYEDPVLLWYAENINSNKNKKDQNAPVFSKAHLWQGYYMEDVVSLLTPNSGDLKPTNPSILPPSRLFKDIGWVAMHSDMGNADNDVWMLFKSSPYGSFSHSHADQNSFQLNAYGESLFIDSGYYPWYGSPHHFLWSRQTKAHNAILVNGKGQHVQSMEAGGTIEKYEYADGLTIVTGECAKGYNLPISDKVIGLWKENMDGPLPDSNTKTHLMRRTVVFNHTKEKPWIVIQDYIKTGSPATFDYLLHSLEKMKMDTINQRLLVQKGNAALDVYLISSEALDFNQTDKFTVDPGESDTGKPKQWHFSGTNIGEREEIHFLTLIVPRRANEAPRQVKRLDYDTARGFQIGDKKVLAWFGEGEKGGITRADGKEESTKLIIEHVD